MKNVLKISFMFNFNVVHYSLFFATNYLLIEIPMYTFFKRKINEISKKQKPPKQ